MKHETSSENDLTVSEGAPSFDDWATKQHLRPHTAEKVRTAQVLLLPLEEFRGQKGLFFPESTEKLYISLRSMLPEDVEVEVPVEDEDYREIALYHELVDLGIILIADVSFPITLSVIANYIYDRFCRGRGDRAIKVSLAVEDRSLTNKRSMTFTYEGLPENFPAVKEQIEEIWSKQ